MMRHTQVAAVQMELAATSPRVQEGVREEMAAVRDTAARLAQVDSAVRTGSQTEANRAT